MSKSNFKDFSDFIGICRTCTEKTDNLISVFTVKMTKNGQKSYAQMIRICTSVEVCIHNTLTDSRPGNNKCMLVKRV